MMEGSDNQKPDGQNRLETIDDLKIARGKHEEKIQELDKALATMHAKFVMSIWIGGVLGTICIGFLGYSSFFQIPSEVKQRFNSEVGDELNSLVSGAQSEVARIDRRGTKIEEEWAAAESARTTDYFDLVQKVREELEVVKEIRYEALFTVPPVGTVVAWSGHDYPPHGWLLCNGYYFAVDDYPELYRLLGTKYGPEELIRGDGSEKVVGFRIPDYSDVFLKGVPIYSSRRDGIGVGIKGEASLIAQDASAGTESSSGSVTVAYMIRSR